MPSCGFLHSGQFIFIFIVRSPSTRRSSLLQVLGDDRQAVEALERIKAVRESHDPVCPHSYGLLRPSVCTGLIFVQKGEQAAYLGKPF